MEVTLILRTFCYTEVAESKAQRYQAASTFASLRPPMPSVGMRIVLQKNGCRSLPALAAWALAKGGGAFRESTRRREAPADRNMLLRIRGDPGNISILIGLPNVLMEAVSDRDLVYG
jgi:hypothetical protein